MITINIDYRNYKIIGYNTIVTEDNINNPDCIILDGDEEKNVLSNFFNNKLYYINGKIIEKDNETDEKLTKLVSINEQIRQIKNDTDDANEYRLFMDAIINGMSVEEAVQISKNNREQLKSLESERDTLIKAINDDVEQSKLYILEKEEASINYKYFISGLAVVRDENDYLEEWIRYHIEEIGFEHFFIYDNESEVSVQKYLESVEFKYLDKLTIIPWKTTKELQKDAYENFLANYKNETRWALAFDPDEYVVINDERSLIDILKDNHQYASIRCQWKFFNANGQEKKLPGTDIEKFKREVEFEKDKYMGKDFFQTNRVIEFLSHVPLVRDIATVSVSGERPINEFFQLNHYICRSWEEWKRKIDRGTCVSYHSRKYSEFFELNPDMMYLYDGDDYKQAYGSKETIDMEDN